jgi:hypothetical protein
MKQKPNPIFVEVNVLADRGSIKDLQPYVEAAHAAIMKIATREHVLCGAIGRRGKTSRSAMTRYLKKYGLS